MRFRSHLPNQLYFVCANYVPFLFCAGQSGAGHIFGGLINNRSMLFDFISSNDLFIIFKRKLILSQTYFDSLNVTEEPVGELTRTETIYVGSNIELKCQIPGATPQNSRWLKDDGRLPDNVQVIDGELWYVHFVCDESVSGHSVAKSQPANQSNFRTKRNYFFPLRYLGFDQ